MIKKINKSSIYFTLPIPGLIILNTVIRKIKDDELDQMAIIWNQHHELITTSKRVVDREVLINYRISQPDLEYLGCFNSNNVLLGFITIWMEKNGIFINQIAVHRTHQRKCIATKLIQFVINRMRNNPDKTELKLTVMMVNIKALKFFLKLGFEIIDYTIEKEYLPKTQLKTTEDYLRLAEYKMILFT